MQAMQYSHAAIPPYPQVIAADVLTIATDFQTIRLSAYSPVSGNVRPSPQTRRPRLPPRGQRTCRATLSASLVFRRLTVNYVVRQEDYSHPTNRRMAVHMRMTRHFRRTYFTIRSILQLERQRPRKRIASPSAAHAEGMFAQYA